MAAGDLAQVSDVQAYINLNTQGQFPPTESALLQRLITASSDFIRTYTGRQGLLSQPFAEVFTAGGGQQFIFAEWPVTAVSLVVVDSLTIPAVPDFTPAPPGFSAQFAPSFASGFSFTPTKLIIQGYDVYRGARILLNYTAGYAAVPNDLQQACIELVALRYKERERIGQSSKHLPDGATISYSQADMSRSTRTVLDRYRRVFPVLTQAYPLGGTESATASNA